MFIVQATFKDRNNESQTVHRLLPAMPMIGDIMKIKNAVYTVKQRAVITSDRMQKSLDKGEIAAHAAISLEFVKDVPQEDI